MRSRRNSNFSKHAATPLQGYIMPIIPAGARLSPRIELIPEHVGKIPGLYNAQTLEWTKFAWQNNCATETQLRRWEDQQRDTGPTAAGMNTKEYNGLDTDSKKKQFVDAVERIARDHLADSPAVRCREGSVGTVQFYKHKDHTPPIRKFRAAFENADGKHVLQFLNDGQQVVIEGPHATGKMHYWRNGSLLDYVLAGTLPDVKAEQINPFSRSRQH